MSVVATLMYVAAGGGKVLCTVCSVVAEEGDADTNDEGAG